MDEGRPPERAATLESVSSAANTALVIVIITFVLVLITLGLVIWLLIRSFQGLLATTNLLATGNQNANASTVSPPANSASTSNTVAGLGPLPNSKRLVLEPGQKGLGINGYTAPLLVDKQTTTMTTQPVPVDQLPPLITDRAKDQYVVLLKPESLSVASVAAANDPLQTKTFVDQLANQYNIAVEQIYHNVYFGFSTHMSTHLAAALSSNEHVAQVVADVEYTKCPATTSSAHTPDLLHAHVKTHFEQRVESRKTKSSRRQGGTRMPLTQSTPGPISKSPLPAPVEATPAVLGRQKSTTLLRPPRPWGLDRICAACTPLVKNQDVATASEQQVDADVFIFDTGVDPFNPNMDVVEQHSFVPWEQSPWDYDGHGTHVAGTAAAIGVGVAQGARIHNIKVLDRAGKGLLSTVLAGVDYVVGQRLEQLASTGGNQNCSRFVLNVSLGADIGTANLNILDQALVHAGQLGMHVVAAAGNLGKDMSTFSPAHTVSGLFAVSASDQTNALALWSNSSAQAIVAPGVNILSFLPDNKTAILSGSSLAAAHVAGSVALYVAQRPKTSPDKVRQALIQASILVGATLNPNIEHAPEGTSILSIYNRYK